MQFMILAYDGTDPEAINRRLKVRPAHIALGDKMVASGQMLYGVALKEKELMIGSMMIVDFPTREELDKWLEIEPYITGDVWREITITPCQVGPSFLKG